MSDLSIATGALTTNGIVRTGAGKLTYAEASTGGAAVLYDGLSTSGTNMITNLPTNSRISFDTPVKFNAGLYITVVTTNPAIVHTA